MRHTGKAFAQRGWKAQPDGGSSGLGKLVPRPISGSFQPDPPDDTGPETGGITLEFASAELCGALDDDCGSCDVSAHPAKIKAKQIRAIFFMRVL